LKTLAPVTVLFGSTPRSVHPAEASSATSAVRMTLFDFICMAIFLPIRNEA
jgi:hypothetical protein